MNPTVMQVTERIRAKSKLTRSAYLAHMDRAAAHRNATRRQGLSCSNLAHVAASASGTDKIWLAQTKVPNIGIVTSYNDMLSAHQPYARFPDLIKKTAREAGATAQVAGGVPAMCDGVTQGQPGMELSLFSRDIIAQATAISLSHDAFDAVLLLGVCDKIVPGLLIGALAFGHLPAVFVPAGPMSSGLSNSEKAAVRQRHAQGLATREELLQAEMSAYHGIGTCTFYGTANSNQLMMEVMGLHVPGAAFEHPDSPLRDMLTAEATRRVLSLATSSARLADIVDERVVVNAIVALLASGGSTNHTIHLVAMAAAAGISIDWNDFAELSSVVPLMARIYPNGEADINVFHAAGGTAYLIRELLHAGLLHGDVNTVLGGKEGLAAYARDAQLNVQTSGNTVIWKDSVIAPERVSGHHDVLRPAASAFSSEGGLRLVTGNLGRAVVKTSAVKPQHRRVVAPAIVFETQEALQKAFKAGELNRDFIAVVIGQGPRANGMPELHKLVPPLGALQDQGFHVALVTDGRMSGASGKVPAAIHVSPEVMLDGPIGRIRTGDMITLDAEAGILHVELSEEALNMRNVTKPVTDQHGMGRELFAGQRDRALTAEQGAATFSIKYLETI
jgi:phosphogluconate dehydratase